MKDDCGAMINWHSQGTEAGAEARGSPEAGSDGRGTDPAAQPSSAGHFPRGSGTAPTCPKARYHSVRDGIIES